jgi:hypothetical protein
MPRGRDCPLQRAQRGTGPLTVAGAPQLKQSMLGAISQTSPAESGRFVSHLSWRLVLQLEERPIVGHEGTQSPHTVLIWWGRGPL